jgi:hypothetical protein
MALISATSSSKDNQQVYMGMCNRIPGILLFVVTMGAGCGPHHLKPKPVGIVLAYTPLLAE